MFSLFKEVNLLKIVLMQAHELIPNDNKYFGAEFHLPGT